jgi:hypothetical protein
MGYACPVCETPQMDAEHLANHLAITAILGDGAHETWLDEHVPEWADLNEETLGERAVEHAEEEEFPQVFEDTVHDDHEHDHDDERSGALFDDERREQPPRGAGARAPAAPDAEVEEVLEEARELTERRRANARGEDPDGESADGEDGESDATDDESE